MPYGPSSLRVLLIEDNADHAELIQRQLALATERRLRTKWCDRLAGGIHELELAHYDVVLLDLKLPDSDLPDTVRRAVAAAPQLPIVVLTSLADVGLGVNAVKDGAQDYLVKSQITPDILLRSLRYAIERKRTRLEVEKYAQELERSNRDLEHFARVVSHDLKSPLAVLQMDLILVGEQLCASPEAARTHVESARAQAQQMCDLIDGILQLAKVQHATAALAPVDAQLALEQALSNLRIESADACAQITFDTLPAVLGDETQLLQLFQNLIANAIKYRSDTPPEIHISAELLDQEWVFSVADNGLGIAPADRERVFDMFERAHPAAHPGAGIGLATCRRIVRRHGGRIWVDDNQPGGSIFYFTIPLAESAVRVRAKPADE